MKFNDDIESMLRDLSNDERSQFEYQFKDMFSDHYDDILGMAKNSIVLLMNHYKKSEIKKLCKQFGIKGYSNLNKEELLQHFIQELVQPSYIEQQIAKMNESEKLALIMTIEFNDLFGPFYTPIKFDDTFLIFSQDEGNGINSLWVPDEIIDVVHDYIEQDDTLIELRLAYQILEAATNLYGLYSFTQLQKVYEQYLDKKYSLLSIQQWLKQVERVNSEMANFRVTNGIIVSKGLQLEEEEFPYFLKDAKYYMPNTLEELLEYEMTVYGIDDETEFEFMSWLEKNILKDNKFDANAELLSVELLTMMKHALSFDMIQSILESLVQDGILRKRVEVTAENVVKPIYLRMRSWIYHGYTFEEYMEIMDKEERHQQSNVIDFNQHRK